MTDIICSVLQFFTNLIVDHFPDLSVGSSQLGTISSSFETMIQLIAQVNFFIPLPTILAIFSIVYGIKLAKFTLFIVNWVIRRIADIIP